MFTICEGCDRGQRYCAVACRQRMRRQQVRAAGRRYQASPKGKLRHLLRQQSYRRRQSQTDVTHHPVRSIANSPDHEARRLYQCVKCLRNSAWIDPFSDFRPLSGDDTVPGPRHTFTVDRRESKKLHFFAIVNNGPNCAPSLPPPDPDPDPDPVNPFQTTVNITSDIAVGFYQVTVHYDPSVLNLTQADVAGGTGAGFTGTPVTVNIDNSVGTATINHFQLGNSPTGTFSVATLDFTPVGLGTSSLTLSGVTVGDTDGNDFADPVVFLDPNSIVVTTLP